MLQYAIYKIRRLGKIFQDFPRYPSTSFENVSIELQHEPIMVPVFSCLLGHYAYINENVYHANLLGCNQDINTVFTIVAQEKKDPIYISPFVRDERCFALDYMELQIALTAD